MFRTPNRTLILATIIWLIGGSVALAQKTGVEAPPPSDDPSATQPSTQPTTQPTTQPGAELTKPSKNRGWISGTIHDDQGKPVVGLEVRAEKDEPIAMGGPAGGGRRIYRTTTDENGNFVFKEVDAAAYIIVSGSQEQGWIYQPVVAKKGEETKMGTVQLVKV
jgi:hypothetical protein